MLKRNVIAGLTRNLLNKSTIILLAAILCGTVGVAQNIGDYVVGYYVKAYINKKTDDTWREKSFKQEWENLNNNSVETPISQTELEAIINKLPKQKLKDAQGKESSEIILDKTKTFYETIKDKRGERDIDKLVSLPSNYENYLGQDCKKKLEDILNKNSSNTGTKDKEDKGTSITASDINQNNVPNSGSNTNTQSKIPKDEKTSSWWWFWLILGLGGGVFVWEKFLREKLMSLINRNETKSSEEYIKQLQTDKKELKNEIDALNKKIKTLEKPNKEFLEENIAMGQKIEGYEYKPKQSFIADANNSQGIAGQARNDGNKEIGNDGKNNEHNTTADTLYADAIIDGYLIRVKDRPSEDTIFELGLQNAQTANFVVYQPAYQRVVANPSFLEGCDKQVLNNGQNVNIASKGAAQRDAEGKWKIINKLNVIIK